MRPLHLFAPACLPALVLCLLLAGEAQAEAPAIVQVPPRRAEMHAELRATAVISQGPDFSDTPDILNGENFLHRESDLHPYS